MTGEHEWSEIFDGIYPKTYGSRTTMESGEEDVAALAALLGLDGPLDSRLVAVAR